MADNKKWYVVVNYAYGNMDIQPTIDDISSAWSRAIELQGIPGAFSDALSDLRGLRHKKSTWIGPDEHKIMFAVDAYLRHYGMGVPS